MSRHASTVASLAIALVAGAPLGAAEPIGILSSFGWLDRSPPLGDEANDDEPRADAHEAEGDDRTPYVTGMIGSSFSGGDAGGLGNTLFTGEGAMGVSVPRPLGGVRLEVEGRQRAALSAQRPRPGVGGSAATHISGEWTTMANLWRDLDVADHLSLYAGGGLGMGGYSLAADAATPDGRSRVTAFAWQAGGGVAYALTDRLTLDVGARFYGLEPGGAQPSAGPPAAEMLFAVRVADPFRGWLRR